MTLAADATPALPALLDDARAVLPDAVALRRRLHRHPELGLELPRTQSAVVDALREIGLQPRTGSALSSVVADLEGGAGDGPTILLRADMDALPMPEDTGLDYASEVPGAMHACGHDAHVGMLVAAARLLAARRDALAGRVRFMFQPGEEGFGGAALMIDEGVLDGVDAAFAIHVFPNVPSGFVTTRGGPLLASADEIHARIVGRGGHASTPYLAQDPVPVACEAVQALQTLVTRTVDVFDPAVVTIGRISAGTTNNVIPEHAELEGTMRTVSERTRTRLQEGVRRVVTGVAAAHDLRAEVEIRPGYPVTRNDPRFASFAGDVARGLLGERRFAEMPAPVMGAEDFSYVLQQVPGAMAIVGVAPPGVNPAEACGCHSNRMVLDEDALATGIALHAAVATQFLAGRFAAG